MLSGCRVAAAIAAHMTGMITLTRKLVIWLVPVGVWKDKLTNSYRRASL